MNATPITASTRNSRQWSGHTLLTCSNQDLPGPGLVFWEVRVVFFLPRVSCASGSDLTYSRCYFSAIALVLVFPIQHRRLPSGPYSCWTGMAEFCPQVSFHGAFLRPLVLCIVLVLQIFDAFVGRIFSSPCGHWLFGDAIPVPGCQCLVRRRLTGLYERGARGRGDQRCYQDGGEEHDLPHGDWSKRSLGIRKPRGKCRDEK
jgi:hypothetical protein